MTQTFVENVLQFHTETGRSFDCPYIQWILQQEGRPCIDVRRDATLRADWGPYYAVPGIERTLDHEGSDRAQTHQLYADVIAAQPGDVKWRGLVAMLVANHGPRIDPVALATLEAWLDAG